MCKEDVRLARQANVGNVYGAAMTGLQQKMAVANSNRFSVHASVFHAGAAGVNLAVMIAAKVSGGFAPLFTLTDSNHSGLANLETHGQLIFEELWAIDGGTTPPTFLYFADTSWDKDLKEL